MRDILRAVALATLMFGALACDDPAKDKAKATVSEAPPPAATAAATGGTATATESLTIDAAASKVEFVGSKVTGKHEGSFPTFSGKIDLAAAKPEASKITVNIDTTSVKTDNEKLTGHLKSPDFFDTEKFPKASFESTSIKPGGEKGATHTVTGTLDLHGAKKTITFPATVTVAADAVTAKSEFSINRKDFGINYAGKADDLIRDDVVIKLDIKAPRKK
ncbi:MAG: YceI family protein [Polyangiaceae bacterium]|nr:YceI family protein [Polyangiaceae bacterium]